MANHESKRLETNEFFQFLPLDMQPRTERSDNAKLLGKQILRRNEFIRSIARAEYEKDIETARRTELIQHAEFMNSDFNLCEQLKNSAIDKKIVIDATYKLDEIVPVFFGVEAVIKDDGVEYTLDCMRTTNGGKWIPYELNPREHGIIAMHEVRSLEEKFLRGILLDGNGKEIDADAKAQEIQPIRSYPGTQFKYYQTVLSRSDGLVWVESIDNDGNLLSRPRLMLFPLESLNLKPITKK